MAEERAAGLDSPHDCRHCEYFDAGGERLRLTALTGDCLNRNSPRFNPEWNFCCDQFWPYDAGEEPPCRPDDDL